MSGKIINPENVQECLPGELHKAAAHLRERGDFHFLNDEPGIFTTFQLAALIDQLADSFAAGNNDVVKRLWGIFAVTCTWDDARGSSTIGQDVFDKLDILYRSPKKA
ncbi:MAG TPA: hypothetical protein VG733_03195 [Chthoniobacteraceae bacterium]|nr:hypothetical protein [Chthoniobacteraceae bacterium]